MTRLPVLLLALAAALPCHAQPAGAAPQWECLDTRGHKVVQSQPCAETAADLRADAVPIYVWGLVALLTLVWLKMLLPDRRPRTAPVAPELLPGLALASAAGPVQAPGSQPRSAARGQTAAQPKPAAPPQPAAQVRSAVTAQAAAPARPAAWTLEAIRSLDGRRFENFIQGLWQVNGYRADLSGKSADGGAEIKIHSAANGRLFAVAQCRPARSGLLGAGSISGLCDAVRQQSAALGIFYGLAGFAPEAQAFAQGKPVKLVSAVELLTQVSALRPEQQKALLEHVWRRG